MREIPETDFTKTELLHFVRVDFENTFTATFESSILRQIKNSIESNEHSDFYDTLVTQ